MKWVDGVLLVIVTLTGISGAAANSAQPASAARSLPTCSFREGGRWASLTLNKGDVQISSGNIETTTAELKRQLDRGACTYNKVTCQLRITHKEVILSGEPYNSYDLFFDDGSGKTIMVDSWVGETYERWDSGDIEEVEGWNVVNEYVSRGVCKLI